MQKFTPSVPYTSSELFYFRKRISEEAIDLIFQENIHVNNEDDHHHDTSFINSTIQEKNFTFHMDIKLHKKIVKKVLDILNKLDIPLY